MTIPPASQECTHPWAECGHPWPEPFGASEVSWNSQGIGRVTLPCRECGEYRVWTVEER